jgi:transcriptional regulator with XRE-family HTH domain
MAPSRTNQLGKYLKQHREELGLSVRELADKMDVSFGFIGQLESGRKSPTLDMLRKLARALRVPVEDLFALSDHMMTETLPDFGPYLRAKFELAERDIRKLQSQFDEMLDKKRPQPKGGSHVKRSR